MAEVFAQSPQAGSVGQSSYSGSLGYPSNWLRDSPGSSHHTAGQQNVPGRSQQSFGSMAEVFAQSPQAGSVGQSSDSGNLGYPSNWLRDSPGSSHHTAGQQNVPGRSQQSFGSMAEVFAQSPQAGSVGQSSDSGNLGYPSNWLRDSPDSSRHTEQSLESMSQILAPFPSLSWGDSYAPDQDSAASPSTASYAPQGTPSMSSVRSLQEWSYPHTDEIRTQLPTYYCDTIENLKQKIGDKPPGINDAREWNVNALIWSIAQLKSGETTVAQLKDRFKVNNLPLNVANYLINNGQLSNSIATNDFIINCTPEQKNRLLLAAEMPAMGQNRIKKSKVTAQEVIDYGGHICRSETIRDASENAFSHRSENCSNTSTFGSSYLRKFKPGIPKPGRIALDMEPGGPSTAHTNMFNLLIPARAYLKQNTEVTWLNVSEYVSSVTHESRNAKYFTSLLDKTGELRMTRNNKDNVKAIPFYNWLHHHTNEEKLAQWNSAGE